MSLAKKSNVVFVAVALHFDGRRRRPRCVTPLKPLSEPANLTQNISHIFKVLDHTQKAQSSAVAIVTPLHRARFMVATAAPTDTCLAICAMH